MSEEGRPAPVSGMGDWEPVGRTTRRRLDSMVLVRFSPDEVAQVRAKASSEALSVSEYIRRVVMQHSEEVKRDE